MSKLYKIQDNLVFEIAEILISLKFLSVYVEISFIDFLPDLIRCTGVKNRKTTGRINKNSNKIYNKFEIVSLYV